MFLQPAFSGDSATARSASPHPLNAAFQEDSSAESTASSASRRLSGWDCVGMLAGFLLTIAVTMINSRGRVFWEDEMLGWMLLRDSSWLHMIRAWNLGADGGGFSFYLLGRAWFGLVGASVLSFRLFSSVCFGAAFVAIWAGLRRFYPSWMVAFAAFNTFFFSPPLTRHLLEGRFYGLLVMSTAWALWLALVLDESRDPTPGRLYVAAFFLHALLITSHVLGIVFSGCLLAATVVLDRMRGRRRIALYFTIAASWLLLVPEKASIMAAARVGKPHFWTRPPKIADLIGAYSGYSHEILVILFLLLLATAAALRRRPGGLGKALQSGFHQRRAVYVVTLCLLLAPVAFLLEGAVGTWLFTDRYLQPVTVALAYVTAELCLLLWEHIPLPLSRISPPWLTGIRAVASLLFGMFLLFWLFHHVAQLTPSPPDFTEVLTSHIPQGVPVVVEDAFTFTELMSRNSRSGVDYTFLLDWPWAVNPAAPRLEVTQFHLMQNWKLAGYFADHIEPADTFLRDHSRFLLIHDAVLHAAPNAVVEIGNPLEERLAHDPRFEFRKVFTLDRVYHDSTRDTVWLACRDGCGAEVDPVQGPNNCVLYGPGAACCDGQPCMATLPEAVRKKIQ